MHILSVENNEKNIQFTFNIHVNLKNAMQECSLYDIFQLSREQGRNLYPEYRE